MPPCTHPAVCLLAMVLSNSCLLVAAPNALDLAKSGSTPPIVVSENPSVMRVESPLFPLPFAHQFACATFLVRARKSPPTSIQIGSSGFGNATLATIASLTESDCERPLKDESPSLTIPLLATTDRPLRLRVPIALVPNAGDKAKGNIVFLLDDYKPLLVPIDLEHPSQPLRTAMLWFLGIVIPASVAFVLTYLGARWLAARTNRIEELGRFRRHRYDQRLHLDDFFSNLYPELRTLASAEFSSRLRREMQPLGTWAAIPARELKSIDRNFQSNDKNEVVDALANLYPEWKNTILEPP